MGGIAETCASQGGDAQKLLRMCVRSFGMSDMWGGGEMTAS